MNSQYMKVNPNELVIDLPVDEAKVTELMESIKAYGLLQSPNVWLQGMRIIDGFHRVVACQRLELAGIDCIVTDCDEEAFWDARIIAAKPHALISDKRLALWIIDAWKASKWYEPIDEKYLKKLKSRLVHVPVFSESPDHIAVAEALWRADRDDVKAWFDEKAKKWGVDGSGILRALGFNILAIYPKITPQGTIVDEVNQAVGGLSIIEAAALAQQVRSVKWADIQQEKDGAAQWILESRRGNQESFYDYARRKQKEITEEQRIQEGMNAELEKRRYEEWAKTPAGQARIAKERLERLEQHIGSVFTLLENMEIKGIPEAPGKLYALIDAIEAKMARAFPDSIKRGNNNPVYSENNELRERIKEQQRKIESLERALNSKQSATKGLPQAAALSSSEIELMTN